VTKRSKILAWVAASLAGLILIVIIAALVVLRTEWFRDYVREKIITSVEDATGGKVELNEFTFDRHGLTAEVDGFVIHGTEPPGSPPLFEAPRIVLRLKLLAGLKKAIDLEYLGVERPSANVMVFQDGRTNIPTPKVARQSSGESGLETVVNLAIHQVEISDGRVQFLDQSHAFNVRGQDLKVGLMFDPLAARYQGEISMSPVFVVSGSRQPLTAKITIPVTLERDKLQVANARFEAGESRLVISGALQHLASPEVSGDLNLHVALAELTRSIALRIYPQQGSGPQALDATIVIRTDSNVVRIQNASVILGRSHLEASGDLQNGNAGSAADFHGDLSLDELGQLLRLEAQPRGNVQIAGKMNLAGGSNYVVSGNVDARDVSFKQGDSRWRGIRVTSGIQVDPKTIAANNLKVFALGGEVTADARLENLSAFSAKGNLQGFQIQNLTTAFASRPIRYAGTISGIVEAKGDLKAAGATGVAAQARLTIAPGGGPGTPVSGTINADYTGSDNSVSLNKSYVALPNTRIDLNGQLGKQAQIRLESRNLDDLLPAILFSSPTATQPPVALRGGTARVVTNLRGPFDSLQISGQATADRFAVSGRLFDRLAADFQASPSGASVQNGSLSRNGSQAQFSASIGLRNWSAGPQEPLAANVTVRNGDLADVLALAGEAAIRAGGALNADAHISGTVGNPQGAVQAAVVNGTAYDEPFDHLQFSVDLSDQLVNLRSAELAAGEARLSLQGSFTHPRDSFETGRVQLRLTSTQIQLGQFKTLQKQRPGLAGLVNLNADVSGDLRNGCDPRANAQGCSPACQGGVSCVEFVPSAVTADASAREVRDRGQNYGNLTATVRTNGLVANARIDSDFAGSNIQVVSRTQLAPGYPTTGDATIRGLPIERAIAIANLANQVPASGVLSATAHLTGTLDDPHANGTINITKAMIYGEPLDRLDATIDYTATQVNLSSAQAGTPAGRVEASGSFSHSPSDFRSGHADLHVATAGIDLLRVQNVQKSKPGLAGKLRLTADVVTDLRTEGGEQKILPSRFDVSGGATGIEWNGRMFGDATFQGETKGNLILAKIDSNLAKSAIHGTGQVRLQGDFPMEANLSFTNVTYSGWQGLLGPSLPEARPGFDGLVEGNVSVKGPATKPTTLQGELQLSQLALFTATNGGANGKTKTITIQNQGPIEAHVDSSVVRIQKARLAGPSTDISFGGTVPLQTSKPLDVTVNGQADLSLLKEFNKDLYSSGSAVLDAAVRGTLTSPQVNGKIELKNASIESAEWPQGVSNANGEILLNGTSATIRNLTAESGGGKLSVDGFAGFTGTTANYNIRANGNRVRTRYAGVSVITNTNLTLSGTSERSLLSGNVTIERLAYSQQSDVGSILSGSSTPTPAPTAAAGPIEGMQLSVRIQTAPYIRFQSTLTEGLAATADLNLVGTLAQPGMVGRVNITSGNLLFFGNKYTVSRGAVSFFETTKIEPVLDIDLETTVKSVDVLLGVSGPIENLKLTYRSDPPLKFEDIVGLLATGKTPPDATIAAHQPAAPEQSMGQMGASAILSQAIADPLSNRLQRVFGVSQLKVDPTFSSGSVLPQARVTIQQQVSGAITFTYTQDLSQTNTQIIRAEWALTPRFSAVATRDENGVFGIDFLYKKQFR
jgi:translocation and assembly module TamB